MSTERRTDILILGILAIVHLSMGAISRIVEEWKFVGWTAMGGYLVIMIAIYWRFNRDRSSILQTLSYWAIFGTFIITQRFAIVIERTDLLAGTVVRLMIFVPVYLYWVASRD